MADPDKLANIPPWDQPGAVVRRDCEAHRGEFLRYLSRWAFGLSFPGILCLFPVFATFPIALFVLILGRRDLAQMRARRMDPAGLQDTGAAIRLAFEVIVANSVTLAVWSLIIACFVAI